MDRHEILCILYVESDTNPTDGYIVVGGNSKKIQVYKYKTGEYFCTMVGHQDSVTCINREYKILFTGSDDCTVICWNIGEWFADHHAKGSDKLRIIEPHKIFEGQHTECKLSS